MGKEIGDFLGGVIILGGIYLMVRPGSLGSNFVTASTNGIARILDAVTGGQGWNAGR